MSELIRKQNAIDIVVFECGKWTGLAKEICKQIKQLPSAESENTCSGCRYEEAYKTYNAPCANCARWFTDWYERRTDDCI